MPAKKVVIVTGSTLGLGYQCALQVATRHASTHMVVVASRGLAGVEKAVEEIRRQLKPEDKDAVEACNVPLDLSSLESVKSFASWAAQEYPVIDSLVLNAGVQSFDEVKMSKDGFELTFAVNHLGHFYLTQLLLSNLLKSDQPRLVVVSSGVHDPSNNLGVPAPNWTPESPSDWVNGGPAKEHPIAAYPFSKLCNVLFSYELRSRVSDPRLAILIFDPGYCPSTGLSRGLEDEARLQMEAMIAENLRTGYENGLIPFPSLSTPENSGSLMASLAVDDKYAGDAKSGVVTPARYFAIELERPTSDISYNKEYQNKLWELSEKLVAEKVGA